MLAYPSDGRAYVNNLQQLGVAPTLRVIDSISDNPGGNSDTNVRTINAGCNRAHRPRNSQRAACTHPQCQERATLCSV